MLCLQYSCIIKHMEVFGTNENLKAELNYSQFDTSFLNEDSFEQTIIEHMHDKLRWKWLYGPDVKRSSEKYDDVFLPNIF